MQIHSGLPLSILLTKYINCSYSFHFDLRAFTCYCNASEYLLRDILRVERRVFRIIGIHHSEINESVLSFATTSCEKLFHLISMCDSHPLRDMFCERHSESVRTRNISRFYSPRAKTTRFSKSFIKFCK